MEEILFIVGIIVFFAICGLWGAKSEAEKELKLTQEQAKRDILAAKEKIISELAADRAAVELDRKIIESKKQALCKVSDIFAEFYAVKETSVFDRVIVFLRHKRHPAFTSAKLVSEVKKEAKNQLKAFKKYEYIINAYERMFPWLIDFKEIPLEDTFTSEGTAEDEEEKIFSRYLSPEERQKLSKTEKFQHALDRYTNSWDKSNWQIGLFYERYVGYLYERRGYKVIMNGAKERWQDMGIDLIATKDGKTELVQCKYWAKDKTIYEKYIFQLFGTTINYICEQYPLAQDDPFEAMRQRIVCPVFITSTQLSETARKVAQVLHIDLNENFKLDKNYPKIKCNPSSENGKIYHLPFDQQYDNFQVSQTSGAFYAATIEEAERAGFRRAYRWRPNLQQNIFNS